MNEHLKLENHLNPTSKSLYHSPLNKPLNWYCIYTKSRFENRLYMALLQAKFTAFLPTIKVKRVWSDRIKTLTVPLLPSYVFVKICASGMYQLYNFPGFVKMVSFNGKPSVIQTEDIRLLEQVEKYGLESQISTVCKEGDSVRVIRGPLKGWEGKVENRKSNTRITFRLNSLDKSICVELGMADVEKCKVS